MPLIGLCGMMRSGKSTAADELRRAWPGESLPFAFAELLKEEINDFIWRGSGRSIWVRPGDKSARVRRLYQGFGELLREFDPDFWVRACMCDVRRYLRDDPTALAVITDVRYPNEADAVQAHGGLLVETQCDPAVRLERITALDGLLPADACVHPSETALAGRVMDAVIGTNTEDEMRADTTALIARLRGGIHATGLAVHV